MRYMARKYLVACSSSDGIKYLEVSMNQEISCFVHGALNFLSANKPHMPRADATYCFADWVLNLKVHNTWHINALYPVGRAPSFSCPIH